MSRSSRSCGKKTAPAANLLDTNCAVGEGSAQQIWLAGMGAFGKPRQRCKVSDLGQEGVSLQRKTQAWPKNASARSPAR